LFQRFTEALTIIPSKAEIQRVPSARSHRILQIHIPPRKPPNVSFVFPAKRPWRTAASGSMIDTLAAAVCYWSVT
jgi:hypothetical protein